MAINNNWGFNNGCFFSWICWCLLQKHFLMYIYLWAMFFIIAALIGFVIFAFAVTDKGSGRPVMNRAYSEYYLQDYSGWLEERVSSQSYWEKISSCIRDSHGCGKMRRIYNGIPESVEMFYLRKLSPIESGCCKPPTECGYVYQNETLWSPGGGLVGADPDCVKWSNDQEQLCYNCDSCKAGVLASLKKSWRKVSVINIVILILLVIMYMVAIAAFRHNKRIDNDEPYGETRMEKTQPSRIHF
ncbi:hypothetical protein H5410_058671 [Solanum commersonii]|uniref:Tetraspanin-3 n=1 Tax=Solanum commersonii TaxID=4109 RepID=A0A9J5WRT4_SOLCO|nr:hypothetical protein H5410_058671 [Solanum commersonii]